MAYRSARDLLAGRGFLLLPAAALAVHELRYRLAYGSRANAALASQGHGYLDSLAPWLVLLLGLALGAFLVRVARSATGRPGVRRRRSFAALWLLASASLVAIYAVQELLEGVFSAGHPNGLSGLYGHGGWWSLAAAVVLGAVVAALLRLAAVVVVAASRLAGRSRRRRADRALARPRSVLLAPRGVLACAAAGRAPPRL
jgi:hypothetical protein